MTRVQANASTTDLYANIANLQAALQEYHQHASGPLTVPTGVTNAWQQLSLSQLESFNASELMQQNRTNQAHIQYKFTALFYPGSPTPQYTQQMSNESYISISASVMAPTSRGSITLLSSSPEDSPGINLNVFQASIEQCFPLLISHQYYNTTADQFTAIQAFKLIRQLFRAPSLTALTIGPNDGEVSPGPSVQSSADILE